MTERPEQPPEGRLISRAQKRARLSGRKAAAKAGLSEGHWRAIVTGSRSIAKDTWVAVHGPADTLARMAQVVGVTGKELEAVGRADAAKALRELEATEPVWVEDSQAVRDHIEGTSEIMDELEARLERLRTADPKQQRLVLRLLRSVQDDDEP